MRDSDAIRAAVESASGPAEPAFGPDTPRGEGPSNKQIIDAAKAAYASYRGAVDEMTRAVVASGSDSSLATAIEHLDGTNWSSPGLSSSLTDPFFDSTEMKAAIEKSADAGLKTAFAGAFTEDLPTTDDPGAIGFAEAIEGADAGTASGLILSLDIFGQIVKITTPNLQYGTWVAAPGDLHDKVLGFYVTTTINGVATNLKIILTHSLDAYGFVPSIGTQVPTSTGVFAGSTSQWRPE